MTAAEPFKGGSQRRPSRAGRNHCHQGNEFTIPDQFEYEKMSPIKRLKHNSLFYKSISFCFPG
ncbi:hypothetical protein BGLA2_350027 [Burkholderia gladioli]|nr:hypothetical protein BGLA2_350027 [Burkholderia gladioli]